MIRGALVAFILSAGSVQAGGILDRYAPDGCVIAPDAARPLQAQMALDNGTAVEQGGWLVLGKEHCTMIPPHITPELSIADPEVAGALSGINRSKEPQDQGCFINPDLVQSALQITRGWSAERAFDAYFEMIAAGIISGDWRFYTDSPLRTPTSVQYTRGDCADVPYAEELAQSHADFLRNYDGFVRANAVHVACEVGETLMYHGWPDVYLGLGNEALPANAMFPFELQLMALGAGMMEGASRTEKGAPRPPFCVHEGLIPR